MRTLLPLSRPCVTHCSIVTNGSAMCPFRFKEYPCCNFSQGMDPKRLRTLAANQRIAYSILLSSPLNTFTEIPGLEPATAGMADMRWPGRLRFNLPSRSQVRVRTAFPGLAYKCGSRFALRFPRPVSPQLFDTTPWASMPQSSVSSHS